MPELEEYLLAVTEDYKQKKETGELPIFLRSPTVGRLKKQCLKTYDQRYNPKDDDSLELFFDVDRNSVDFRKVITNSRDDDFKGLDDYLKDKKGAIREKNIELLAWLIDFKHRPSFAFYKILREPVVQPEPELETAEETDTIIEKGEAPTPEDQNKKEEDNSTSDNASIGESGDFDQKADTKKEETTKETKKPKPAFKNLIIVGCTLLLAGASYAGWEKFRVKVDPNAKCMYWAIDHYELIDCNKTVVGATVINRNAHKLDQLKLITKPDTLTGYSVGKVWYAQFEKPDKAEFFTDTGMHPIDTTQVLRPLTKTALLKYTSHYRYLIHQLTWAFGIFVVVLCVFFCFIYAKRKPRKNATLQTKKLEG